MMHAASDEACVKTCVKGSGEYALFDGRDVFKLSDQKTPAKFAAQRVKVTGTYDEKAKRIKVVLMELARGGAKSKSNVKTFGDAKTFHTAVPCAGSYAALALVAALTSLVNPNKLR